MADTPPGGGCPDHGCSGLFVLLGMVVFAASFWLWVGWRFLRWLFG